MELRIVPFEQQKQIPLYIVDRLPKFTKGATDARGKGYSAVEIDWRVDGARWVPGCVHREGPDR